MLPALLFLICVMLPSQLLAELRNGSVPLCPVTSAARTNLCHFSIGYTSTRDTTSYGPTMGCQWGSRTAFLLDWAIAPGHAEAEYEEVKFGGLAHLALGMKVNLLQIPLGASTEVSWSLQWKAIGGGSVFEKYEMGFEYGGALGTALGLTHPVLWGYSLSWGGSLEWLALGGDLRGDLASTSLDKELLGLGLTLAVNRQDKPTSLFGTWGALMRTSNKSTPVSWVSLGVRF